MIFDSKLSDQNSDFSTRGYWYNIDYPNIGTDGRYWCIKLFNPLMPFHLSIGTNNFRFDTQSPWYGFSIRSIANSRQW